MWLRWVASNIARQSARQKIVEAAGKAMRSITGDQASPKAKDGQAAATRPATEVALLFALGVESGGTVDLLKNTVTTKCANFLEHFGVLGDRAVVVAESGVGPESAAKATADVIHLHRPGWVVSTGFASALHADLRRGDFLMADAVKDLDGNRLDIGLNVPAESIQSTPALHTGTILSVDEMVHAPDRRRELAQLSGAAACDMETMAVAQVCQSLKTRFLSVRLITECLDDRLPPEVEALYQQQTTAGRFGAVTGAMFKRLSSLKDMWKLKGDAMKASDRLARFLQGVVEQLESPVESADAATDSTAGDDSQQPGTNEAS